MRYKLILSGLLAVLTVFVIYQNAQPVKIRFLFWSLETSQVVLMACMLIVGMTISWLMGSWLRYRSRHRAIKGGADNS